MGQYYVIVNLDKREILCPHKFGEGVKLMEFGHSCSSVLLALTVLLANGNGRGGGDIHTSSYDKAIERWHKQKDEWHKGERKRRPTFPNCDKYNKPFIGRWAGDRIVIAGDYGDPGKFIEDADNETLQKIANKRFSEGCQKREEVNLHFYAEETFTDISKEILAVLADAGELPTEEDELKSLRPDILISAAKKN